MRKRWLMGAGAAVIVVAATLLAVSRAKSTGPAADKDKKPDVTLEFTPAEVTWFWFQGRWLGRLSAHAWLTLAAAVTVLRFALVAAFGSVPWLLVLLQCSHALTFAAQHSSCIAVIRNLLSGLNTTARCEPAHSSTCALPAMLGNHNVTPL